MSMLYRGMSMLRAISQGAVGAVIAASLSAVAKPVAEDMLVRRVSLMGALKAEMIKHFLHNLVTNFIKFPFFEATNIIMQGVDLSPTARGAVLGSLFCTITLPITNCFRRFMNRDTEGNLYQAYGPTVVRDIVYGIARQKVLAFLTRLNPAFASTRMGRIVNMFATVVAACVLSAPGNALRGYCLQPPDRKQSFGDFFQPAKIIRSTSVGAIIMGISTAIGTTATPQVLPDLANVLIITMVMKQMWDLHGPVHASVDDAEWHHRCFLHVFPSLVLSDGFWNSWCLFLVKSSAQRLCTMMLNGIIDVFSMFFLAWCWVMVSGILGVCF